MAHRPNRQRLPPPPKKKDTDRHDNQGRPVPEPVNDTDARLAYVAVTRARQHLGLGGRSWITTRPSRVRPAVARRLPDSSPSSDSLGVGLSGLPVQTPVILRSLPRPATERGRSE